MARPLALVLIALCITVASFCAPPAPAATPAPEAEAPRTVEDAPAKPRTYRFGVITLNHPLVIYQQYQPFLDFLAERQPWRFELVLEHRYSTIVDRLEAGTLDIALLAGRTFLQAQGRTPLIALCAVLGRDGTPTTRSLIVAREDRHDIRAPQDLKGKHFAFGSPDSTASYLAPLDHLTEHGVTLGDFATHANLPTHDAVARAVLRGEYDAGAVGEPMAVRYLGAGLRVVDATPPFPGFIIVARADVPGAVRSALRDALLGIDPAAPDVARLSEGWNEVLRHGFGPVDASVYETFRTMERRVGLSPETQEAQP